MSDTATQELLDDFLEHHGVKGQKWGVRHNPKALGSRNRAKIQGRKIATNNFSPSVGKINQWQIAKAARQHNVLLGDVRRINKSPKYKGRDLRKDAKLRKQYVGEVAKSMEMRLQNTANARINDKGKYKVSAYVKDWGPLVVRLARIVVIKHADDSVEIPLKYNAEGFIVEFGPIPEVLMHSDVDFVSDYLEHHGIKGQKWGVRRKKRPNPQSNGSFKPGNRAYDTRRLSNKELKKVVERMKLEQQYADLNQKTRSKGKKYTEEVLQNTGKAVVGAVATAVVAHFVKNHLLAGKNPPSNK